jgi:hypothetical protein
MSTEDEILSLRNDLGVGSWSDITAENISELVQRLPSLSGDAIQSLIEMLPALKELGLDGVRAVQSTFESTVEANATSNSFAHSAFADARRIFEGQLERADIDENEREALYKLIVETSEGQAAQDTSNKSFLKDMLTKTLPAVIFVSVGMIYLGAKIAGGSGPSK